METQGRIEAWIVDDTGFAKKGVHSVGVARQYCGRLGKTDNCQIAVTLSIANHEASLPIAYRLYLPEEWANDAARRSKAHVPDDVKFRTKPEIALIRSGPRSWLAWRAASYWPTPLTGLMADSAPASRRWGLTYAVAVQSTLSVWPPGMEPLPPKPWSGRGRTPSRVRREGDHRPVSAKTLATTLPTAGLARRVLARGLQPNLDLALRRGADTAGLARRETRGPASARMVAHRMARGRARADEILALDPARGHSDRSSRRHRQTALAHRTRL